jgi:ferric-dicitrate binding protein FerR (iron transport regulator)
VRTRTEAAFSALVELDPLRGAPESRRAASGVDPTGAEGAGAETCIARITATPRTRTTTAAPAAPPAPQWRGAPYRRKARYGAIGLVASAAIAVVTTLLWASPSAGSPPDQAINVTAQVVQMHSPSRT